jgi:alpha-beta hydrolase superfamily lysophospholipase
MRHHILEKSVDMFPVDTARSMFDFKAEDLIHKLAPRPLLLLHSSVDSVTPTEQSIALFERAGKPKDLHLFNETDHFMFAESMPRVRAVVKDWLNVYFPLKP